MVKIDSGIILFKLTGYFYLRRIIIIKDFIIINFY